MASAFLAVAMPHQTALGSRSVASSDFCFHRSRASASFSSPTFVSSLSSSFSSSFSSFSSSSSVVEEGEKDRSEFEPLSPQFESSVVDVNNSSFSGCRACGRDEVEKGCNGEGRIQGGIATVPGFGWWPIKAYRPCPGFIASGGRYKRQGQSMDEVAGGGKRGVKRETSSKDQSGKRKPGFKQFKI